MPGHAPSLRSHVTLALITLLHCFTHAYGTILVPLYLPMRDDLRLWGVGAASLIVTLYTFVYCLFSYPAGVLADRSNRKVLLGVGLIVNAAAILLMGLTRRYEMLVLLGLLGGLAGTLFHPAANALGTAHYPRSPGMAIGVISIGAAIGFFAGPRYAGWRAEVAGWQSPLVEAGLFGLAWGVIFLLVAKEAPRPTRTAAGMPRASSNGDVQAGGVTDPAHVPMGRALRRRMVGVALLLSGRDFAGIASLTLTSLYLQKARGYTVAQAGLVVGSMMLVAIVANPLAVYLSPGKRRLPMLFGILIAAASIIVTVPFVDVAWVLPVLCVFQACHLGSFAVAEAAMLERVPAAVRGRVIGIFITVAGTLASASPWVMGAWTDAMKQRAYEPRAYALPFGMLAVLLVVSSLSVLVIRRLGPTPPGRRSAVEPAREISPATLEVAG